MLEIELNLNILQLFIKEYIYIQYKFNDIPSIGYLIMAKDGKNHWNLGNRKAINPL